MANDFGGKNSGLIGGNSTGSGVSYPKPFKFPEGVSLMRHTEDGPAVFDIIPYRIASNLHPSVVSGASAVGDFSIRLYYKTHFIKRGKNGFKVICPTTYGYDCPICKERERLAKEYALANFGTDDIRTLKGRWPKDKIPIDVFMPKERVLYLVIDRMAENPTYQLFEQSRNAFDFDLNRAVADIIKWKKLEDFEYAHPTEGSSIRASVVMTHFADDTESPLYPKYTNVGFEPREQQYTFDIADKAPSLDTMMNILPYEEIERLFFDQTYNGAQEVTEPEAEDATSIAFNAAVSGTTAQYVTPEAPVVLETPQYPTQRVVPDNIPVPASVCPAGHVFGVDFLSKPGCDTCENATLRMCGKAGQGTSNQPF